VTTFISGTVCHL